MRDRRSQLTEKHSEPSDAQMMRGLLLAMLAEAYPKERSEVGLKAEISVYSHEVEHWDHHVQYLIDDGYVQATESTIGAKYGHKFKLRQLRITTRGIDLMDGSIPPDDGIYIPE